MEARYHEENRRHPSRGQIVVTDEQDLGSENRVVSGTGP